jgi:D-aminopeptidase
MRVAIVFDMEGVSHIGDMREPFPMYEAYWRTGRAKLTSDIVAAARGLLRGGATEVVVINHHGAGEEDWPNAIPERFPDHVTLAEDYGCRGMREHVDAMFQVGVHARGGIESFLSHTAGVGIRYRLGSELLSESHLWAYTGSVPLIGMVGSVELGETLCSLADVPFLGVQRSTNRAAAHSVFATPAATADAIEAFAVDAMREAISQPVRRPAGPVRLQISVQNPDEAEPKLHAAGWNRTSRTEFELLAATWRDEAETIDEGIWEAAGAAFQPYDFWFADLDPSTEEAALAFPSDRLARSDAMLVSWSAGHFPEWFGPDAPTEAWEGFEGVPVA